jgi:hypothetical protein
VRAPDRAGGVARHTDMRKGAKLADEIIEEMEDKNDSSSTFSVRAPKPNNIMLKIRRFPDRLLCLKRAHRLAGPTFDSTGCWTTSNDDIYSLV